MAKWLKKNMPDNLRVLVSPARRARETAAALGLEVETIDEIAPDAAPAAVIAATSPRSAKPPRTSSARRATACASARAPSSGSRARVNWSS
jgi:hypothetical protein